MAAVRNILFIMCDQLRWDYLSCFGHPTLRTPNIDALAARGVRFANAFVQSASCGPSRMSFYTGRYVSSHRAFANFVALPIDERTLGDYLRPLGLRVAVDGKTHAEGDAASLRARGIDPASPAGVLAMEAGFEPYDRHDGVLTDGATLDIAANRYTTYLQAQGYAGPNPWLSHANSAVDGSGSVLSGWHMRYAQEPARVAEPHSETAYSTDRAIEFIREQGDAPWCLHLSYIKPHWPYVAPSPYNAMYRAADVVPPVRHAAERLEPHPILAQYLRHEASRNFSKDEVRYKVIPVYMGLVRQVDDHLGRLFDAMEAAGRWRDTMVVFCSDHGDYLGDHYLGEKELFHDSVGRMPLIVYDPDAAADATRGTVEVDRFVEAIDLLPTFVSALGARPNADRLEGTSLLPLLRGEAVPTWRTFTVSEFDYSFRTATRQALGRPVKECGMITLRDHRYKYVHCDGFRPLLFDLQQDPQEFFDLGGRESSRAILEEYAAKLAQWLLQRRRYTTCSDRFADTWLQDARYGGMKIGVW
ncbi:MAG: sulfatase-like hydrolase/transferase [Burkholderiales bacterium]|nr:sulfatase-like hydrolase/transferase [Burkholderiales bacterium]